MKTFVLSVPYIIFSVWLERSKNRNYIVISGGVGGGTITQYRVRKKIQIGRSLTTRVRCYIHWQCRVSVTSWSSSPTWARRFPKRPLNFPSGNIRWVWARWDSGCTRRWNVQCSRVSRRVPVHYDKHNRSGWNLFKRKKKRFSIFGSRIPKPDDFNWTVYYNVKFTFEIFDYLCIHTLFDWKSAQFFFFYHHIVFIYALWS